MESLAERVLLISKLLVEPGARVRVDVMVICPGESPGESVPPDWTVTGALVMAAVGLLATCSPAASSTVPPEMARLPATALPADLLRISLPALTIVRPVKVLALEPPKVSLPEPILKSRPGPGPLVTTPL